MNYLLYNPNANNGLTMKDLQDIKNTLLNQEYKEINLLEITDYQELVSAFLPEDTIYIIGGDGTLNKFLNHIKKLVIPGEIYYYPAGTGNDFMHDVDEEGKLYRIRLNDYIDKLPVVTVNGKEYSFLNGIGFGIDGYCCEEGDRLKAANPNKKINYTTIAIKGLFYKYKPRNAKITVDGVTKEYKKVWLAPAMFGRYYGGGMKVAPDQDRNNIEHTVSSVVMYGTGKLKTLIRFPKIFTGEHVKYTDMVEIYKGHEIKVEFDKPCALQVDGETILNVTEYSVRYN